MSTSPTKKRSLPPIAGDVPSPTKKTKEKHSNNNNLEEATKTPPKQASVATSPATSNKKTGAGSYVQTYLQARGRLPNMKVQKKPLAVPSVASNGKTEKATGAAPASNDSPNEEADVVAVVHTPTTRILALLVIFFLLTTAIAAGLALNERWVRELQFKNHQAMLDEALKCEGPNKDIVKLTDKVKALEANLEAANVRFEDLQDGCQNMYSEYQELRQQMRALKKGE